MIKLPQFIVDRIEELNEQKEDMYLTQDQREELQLLESIPSAITLQNAYRKEIEILKNKLLDDTLEDMHAVANIQLRLHTLERLGNTDKEKGSWAELD